MTCHHHQSPEVPQGSLLGSFGVIRPMGLECGLISGQEDPPEEEMANSTSLFRLGNPDMGSWSLVGILSMGHKELDTIEKNARDTHIILSFITMSPIGESHCPKPCPAVHPTLPFKPDNQMDFLLSHDFCLFSIDVEKLNL